jgi:DNA mismatch repair ATPase MutS
MVKLLIQLLSKSYFDQASEVAHLLSIKLTTKSWGGQRVPMCGFPLMHLDRHSKTLVQQHKRFVAMCEEFKRSDGTFDRRVVRVVTPGTLIDESFLNHYENNYLAAVSSASDTILSPGSPVGLAWIDVSTGDFFSQDSTIDSLRDDLARIGPREVVLDTSVKLLKDHPFRTALGEEVTSISYTSPDSEDAVSPPPAAVSDDIRLSSRPVFSSNETAAIRLLTSFLHAHLLESMPQLTAPSPEIRDARMHIDSHTIKALEIKEGMREGGVTGSLLSVIKRTVTSSGTRLLARRLCTSSFAFNRANVDETS